MFKHICTDVQGIGNKTQKWKSTSKRELKAMIINNMTSDGREVGEGELIKYYVQYASRDGW